MATNKNFEVKNGLSVGGTERISSAGAFAGSLASGVTATTQSAADSSTKIATTAYTDAAITALIGGAPSALNDLNELAAAIADDANYSTTLTTALATKLPLAGGTLTGDLILGDNVKIEIGSASGGDLQLYHDGGNSYIKNTTGWLNMPVGGNGISIANSDFSEQISKFLPNGACELYYNGSEKLATASGGVTVTGTLTATNLNVVHSGQAIIKAEGVNQYYVGMMIKNNYSSTQSQWHVAAAGGSSGWGASNGNFIIRDDTTNSTGIEIERGAGGASGALYIDSDGAVSTPHQPGFFARGNTSQWLLGATSSWQILTGGIANSNGTSIGVNLTEGNQSHLNGYDTGSDFNTSNGRFTAPVDGKYHIHGSIYCMQNTPGIAGDYIHFLVYVNGQQINEIYTIGGYGIAGAIDFSLNLSTVLYLEETDFVTWNVYTTSNNMRIYGDHLSIGAHMIS